MQTQGAKDVGLRRSNNMIRALLAKLRWKVISYADEACCRVPQAKYDFTENGSVMIKTKA